ncbi:hypothetical protein ACTWP5_04360 [Streptomyces sp. 4N509B]|uniref:hypothetical protein n=1 Tax=Streptomyces sp. 4N509B TaxID=3457413 RepID=UPI003FCFF051
MGIEGEKLVFDYLSRVGDLAHGTDMSAVERRQLVNRLRDEISQRRAAAGGAESRSEVRRILGRIGSPEDVVAAATDAPSEPAARPSPSADPPSDPTAGPSAPSPLPVPGPRAPGDEGEPPSTLPPPAPRRGEDPERYREWPDGDIGRFVGGLLPEAFVRRDPRKPDTLDKGEEGGEAADGTGEGVEAADGPSPDGSDAPGGPDGPAAPTAPAAPLPLRARKRVAPAVTRALTTRRVGGVFEFLAVALLAVGAVIGSLVPMIFGWVLSYWSPRLSRAQAQWATFGMPALVAGAYGLWLLSRISDESGDAATNSPVQDALSDDWPWLLRTAALATAAFLFWRARRPRPQS